MSKRKKRFWSADEKREICHQATAPGVPVAQVARRYAVNANLIFKWLKDPRFAPAEDGGGDVVEADGFLPVEVDAVAPCDGAVIETPFAAPGSSLSATRVDITLCDGRRVLIEGPTALASVVGLVQGLMA